jgi:[protein-PII] uridylyltransferase
MRLLIADQGHYGQVADGVGSEELLLLCAFLHDIGKGHGRDHSEVGAEIARSFARRVSLSEETSDLLEGAVRHHLLLIETATRRDLNDPAVVEEVATTVGGPRLLETLYLLTVADSRATGSSMWSDWKATLLRTLYVRCAALLGVEGLPDEITGTTQSEVLAAASDSRHQEVQMHLSGMPEDYLRSTSLESVLWHLDLISGLSGASRLGVRPGSPVDTAVVLGWTRPGFRRLVAESFAANGIDVLEARLFTRADGLVVDTFQVRDDQTGDRVSVPRWESTRRDIEASLLGELDTVSKVAARAAVYLHQPSRTPVPRVECSVDSATGDVVVGIRCSDRIGRLAEILAIFASCGLEVRLAKLDSRGDELVDTFHVMAESHVGDEQGMRDLAGLIEASLTS